MTFAQKRENLLLCSSCHDAAIAGPTCLIAHLLPPPGRASSLHTDHAQKWLRALEPSEVVVEARNGALTNESGGRTHNLRRTDILHLGFSVV